MLINIIVLIFLVLSVVFTIKYRFIQFKSIKMTKKIILKEKSKTAYQTFLVALASHIGTGNIVGVTSALIIGGPGSMFWMWIYAIFSSIFSLMENTLAQVFKVKINGEYRGGSCFYILGGLNKKYIALLIALFLVLSNSIFFQPLQVNTVSESIFLLTNIPKHFIFIILVAFTLLVIFRGTKKIIRFSEIIVPIMSISYIAIGLLVIFYNYKIVPTVIQNIFAGAFTMKSFFGGCIFVGLKRSMFSHEAGLGTMPTISAMSEVKKPIEQGYISCFGVFVDTILMCSITGFMVLIYNIDFANNTYQGCDLMVYVFKCIFGDYGIFLAVFFMITFALATVVSQYYLGESNLMFISFYTKNEKVGKILYKLLFITGIFIGVFVNISSIWQIIDIGMVLLGVINIYAIIKLHKTFELNI